MIRGAGHHVQHARRRLFLSLILLSVVGLTQVVVLNWGPETTFFVTWLLLALTVQHDSRTSAAIGLVFLASCPFLLIAEKEAVAELAANYAYFLLAIGVLVQLEELVLEQRGWSDRKVDLLSMSRPIAVPFARAWLAAEDTLAHLLINIDPASLARPIKIAGSAGLAMVWLGAVVVGAPFTVVFLLLVLAILFTSVVWGFRPVLQALRHAWVVRAMLTAVMLLFATVGMAWLHDLVSADRLARMESVFDFVESVNTGMRTSPTPEGESIGAQAWTIDGVTRSVLYQHPAFAGASRAAYTLSIGKNLVLAFELATSPGSWEQPGDGVTFVVYVQSGSGRQLSGEPRTEQVFSTYIDPKQDEIARRWHPRTVDLSRYAGQDITIIFETGTGPAGDYRFDWAGWGRPRLLAP